MRMFLAAFMQTLRDVFADKSAKSVMIGAVILYSVFYPAAYRSQVASDLPVIVVDEDHGSASRALIRKLENVRAIRVAGVTGNPREARDALQRGEVIGMVVLPEGLQRDVLRGRQGHVAIQANGAWLGSASSALAGAGDAITAFATDAAIARAQYLGAPVAAPLGVVQRPLFNTREGYGSAVVPGVAVLIIHQTLLLGMGVLLATRRQQAGGLRPRYTLAQLAAMSCAFGLIGSCGLLYFSGFTFWVQDYPRGGNLAGLLLADVLFLAATVPFGLWIGSFFDTRTRPFQYITVASMLVFFLANLSWPVSSTPLPLQWLARLLPTTPGITALIQFNQMDARIAEAAPQLWNLAALAVLYGSLAAWRLCRRAPADHAAIANRSPATNASK